jgi:O-methyltransferase involved in polyketide biosynthesis
MNWSKASLWETGPAKAYLKKLNLLIGKDLDSRFDDEANHWHTQVVTGRKFGIKKHALEFLKQFPQAQVVILGAGIAPLSIELGSLFPLSKIFDVDQSGMIEKETLIHKKPNNIQFIECDVTSITWLIHKLQNAGFDSNLPMMIIMEGIVYYLSPDALMSMLKHFRHYNAVIVCDFSVYAERVHEKTRPFAIEVRKKMMESADLPFFTCYNEDEMIQVMKMAGYQNIHITNTRQLQQERTGSPDPFTSNDMSWNRVLIAQ